MCATQNSFVFNSDSTFVRKSSGNTCDNNDKDTVQITGTYMVRGFDILFDNETMEIVEQGDGSGVTVFSLTRESFMITTITEIQLSILLTLSDGSGLEETFNLNFTR